MKKIDIFIVLIFTLFSFSCSQKKVKKNDLNHISFNLPTETMIDSMRTAVYLLDKMDYSGNGASCFVVDGKLHYSRQERGFGIIDLTQNKTSLQTITLLGQKGTERLFTLFNLFSDQGISSMGKSSGGIYSFLYKQKELNPHNDYKKTRIIVYLTENTDTCTQFFQDHIRIDRYRNLILLAPNNYAEPKLPMDKKSIMKRTEELKKEREQKIQEIEIDKK